MHNALKYQLRKSKLKKRYVYHVHVTRNPLSFSGGPMRGQLPARDFVVPDVRNEKPMLVVDTQGRLETLSHTMGMKNPCLLLTLKGGWRLCLILWE
ncbi:hypothetical protein [Methanothermobacter wolfeii]|uniref:hypothetical protein n=1 Tax=Methanothermobacter wolfeii TaxID=145261 RepID=UPI0024B34384|nr:hypothetical protein [Methanothermobacter wolfeii]MDI6701491.1 hypothetical protein [Methanothermobacter wolfeii]